MTAKMSEYQRFVLSITCPKCGRGQGHYCRNERGKCVPPHSERFEGCAGSVLCCPEACHAAEVGMSNHELIKVGMSNHELIGNFLDYMEAET